MENKKRKHPLSEINSGEPMLRRRPSFSEGYHRTEEEKACMRLLLETAQKFVPHDKKILSERQNFVPQDKVSTLSRGKKRARRSDW